MFFGIGVPAFTTESGSGIVRGRSTLPGSDVKKDSDLFGYPERPAHQVSPPLSTHRLAGVRYQLDNEFLQAGIVDNGRQQEDPAVRWPGKHAYTDAICRNVITPLASRFQTHGFR